MGQPVVALRGERWPIGTFVKIGYQWAYGLSPPCARITDANDVTLVMHEQ